MSADAAAGVVTRAAGRGSARQAALHPLMAARQCRLHPSGGRQRAVGSTGGDGHVRDGKRGACKPLLLCQQGVQRVKHGGHRRDALLRGEHRRGERRVGEQDPLRSRGPLLGRVRPAVPAARTADTRALVRLRQQRIAAAGDKPLSVGKKRK